MPASYVIYVWHEDRLPGLAEDSILDRLAEDPNLPDVDRISFSSTLAAFKKVFPDISVENQEFYWEGEDGSFRVSFILDERKQPIVIRISSAHPLYEKPKLDNRVSAAIRETGCTLFESKIE
jgi:hypothetical protein